MKEGEARRLFSFLSREGGGGIRLLGWDRLSESGRGLLFFFFLCAPLLREQLQPKGKAGYCFLVTFQPLLGQSGGLFGL